MTEKPLLIIDRSVPGRIGYQVPESDVPATDPRDVLPDHLLRDEPARLPEVSEPEVVRHYVNLSIKNHHVDRDLYPLGSCTMKYNPKVNDTLAGLPGFSRLHPRLPESKCQGALELMHRLEEALIMITGMPAM